MEAVRTPDEIRDVNTRYHDVAASSYDSKWGIDFGEIGQNAGSRQAAQAARIGAGTRLSSARSRSAPAPATSASTAPGRRRQGGDLHGHLSGDGRARSRANARRLGLNVRAARADAESLPFPDQSFDLVLGHAVLHHLPDLSRAFSEFQRVLRPGGRIAFAGEPSRFGDHLAAVPKRAAAVLAPAWRTLMRAAAAHPPAPGSDEHDDHRLERFVDIHAFAPADLTRHAKSAGFTGVSVRGEELVANWFGWFNRALEASANPDDVPMLWRQYAFHGYLLLQRLDEHVLEPMLPPAIFYNLLLTARKP